MRSEIPLEILIQTTECHPIQMACELGLTYEDLALALGVSVDAVKSWACKRRTPSVLVRRYAAVRLQAIKSQLELDEQ